MAIIKSCCFWKSLRKGCYASGIYVFFYFIASCLSTFSYIYEERGYLSGKVDKLQSKSFLGETPMTLWFGVLYFGFSCLGVMSSILVIIGLQKNERSFLAPFIVISTFDLLISLIHFILNVIFGNLKFDPLTGTLYIADFFIHCLNVYCLICVISQYQEYKEYGCENHYMINNIKHHSTMPEKSCIILHQSKMSPVNNGVTNVTLIQETSHLNGSSHIGVVTKSPFRHKKNKNLLKKQVKFTDELEGCIPDVLTTIPAGKSEEENVSEIFKESTQV